MSRIALNMGGGMQSLAGGTDPLGLQGANGPAVPAVVGYNVWYNSQQGLFQDLAKTTPAAADNDPVACWADQSGNAHDIVNTGATDRPLLKTNAVGSLPALLFDGTNDFLLGTFTWNNPFSIFVVAKILTQGTNTALFSDSGTGGSVVNLNENFPAATRMSFVDGAGNAFIDGSDIQTRYGVVYATANGGSSVPFGFKSSAVNVTNSRTGSNNMAGLTLCRYVGAIFANYSIAEVIGYPTALGSTDRNTIIAQLGARYGLF